MIVLKKHYGPLVRILHWCTDQAMTNALATRDLTASQGHILGYLSHRKEPPCSRDIEEAFHLSHPTVSGLLTRMEKKGFIEFRPDDSDRRIKRICLLPKGVECTAFMHQTIHSNEERMVRDFTPEERAQFLSLLERAISNMGGDPCPRKHKEEPQK